MTTKKQSIEEFKAQEEVEPIAVLKEPKARALVLAWKYMPPDLADPDLEVSSGDWSALWSGCDVDFDRLANMAAVSVGDARAIFDRLKGYRLIYPDGSITQPAEKYLRVVTKQQLSDLQK